MDFQDTSQLTTTLNTTFNSSLNSNNDEKSEKAPAEEFNESSYEAFDSNEMSFSGLELKVSKIRQIKQRLFAISKRLKESSREKADLMKRIGNMEIQLMHLKELKVEEDFKKISQFQKDISEKSKLNLINLITDTRELMENEKTLEPNVNIETAQAVNTCAENQNEKVATTEKKVLKPRLHRDARETSPETQAIPLDPVAKQKWLRRMLAGKTALSMPSISESTRIIYSKKPNVPVFAVDSQHSQLTKNQCSSLPSETECESCSDQSLDQSASNTKLHEKSPKQKSSNHSVEEESWENEKADEIK